VEKWLKKTGLLYIAKYFDINVILPQCVGRSKLKIGRTYMIVVARTITWTYVKLSCLTYLHAFQDFQRIVLSET